MALKLNIKLFADGDELYVDPSPWNSACASVEEGASQFNSSLENNEQVIAAMKTFLGSPMMTELLRPYITNLTQVTTEAEKYYEQVNRWSNDMMNSFNTMNKTGEAGSIHTSVNEQIMKNVDEKFDGSKIGLRTSSDVDNFVTQVEEVIRNISNSLANTTDAVNTAKGSIPPIITSALTQNVTVSNDNIREMAEDFNRVISDYSTQFRTALSNWAEDYAKAARGGE